MIYRWQHAQWQQLMQMRERMPHALLLHGPTGIGKVAFAEELARSLLCENPDMEGHACGSCDSCGWFAQQNHPDYRRIRPEIMEDETEEEEASAKSEDGSKKTRSKDIRIEQIRGLARMMSVSTHRSGLRIVLLYPAERLTIEAANALLKTLEEPPENTLFLLVADRPDQLLPTILSRCRMIALPMPAQEEALQWLEAQPGVRDARDWLAYAGGAPLAACEAATSDSGEDIRTWQQYLLQPGMDGAFRLAEKFQRHTLSEIISWQQRWLYDLFSSKLTTQVRYHPAYQKEIARLATRADTTRLLTLLRATNERKAVASHPLSQKLVLENMLLEYVAVFTS